VAGAMVSSRGRFGAVVWDCGLLEETAGRIWVWHACRSIMDVTVINCLIAGALGVLVDEKA